MKWLISNHFNDLDVSLERSRDIEKEKDQVIKSAGGAESHLERKEGEFDGKIKLACR